MSATVPQEHRFWTPERLQAFLDRSAAKSDEQAHAGNLPRLVRRNPYETVYTVASRTEGGVYYLLTVSKVGRWSAIARRKGDAGIKSTCTGHWPARSGCWPGRPPRAWTPASSTRWP